MRESDLQPCLCPATQGRGSRQASFGKENKILKFAAKSTMLVCETGPKYPIPSNAMQCDARPLPLSMPHVYCPDTHVDYFLHCNSLLTPYLPVLCFSRKGCHAFGALMGPLSIPQIWVISQKCEESLPSSGPV